MLPHRRHLLANAWSPLQLGSKLKAWWKPPSGANVTLNGATIASWTDAIGNYALAQATATLQPAQSASGYNGGPAAVFDGVDDYLAIAPVPAGLPGGAALCEMWVVGSQTVASADANSRVLLSLGGTTTTTRLQLVRITGNKLRAVSINTAVSDNTADLTGAHVMRGVFGSTVRADVDASQATASGAVTNATGTTRFAAGIAASLAGSTWQGAMAQILITDLLTDAEAAALRAYLGR